MLLFLLTTHQILRVSAAALTEFLKHNGIELRSMSTKTAKIRALMRLPFMDQNLTEDCKSELEQKMHELDRKRQSKAATDNAGSDDEDEMEDG